MACKTEETTIGGHTYIVTQLGALQGRNVLVILTRMIGPAVAGLVKGKAGKRIRDTADSDTETDTEAAAGSTTSDPLALLDKWGDNLASGLEALCTSASEKDFAAICDAFAERTKLRLQTTHTNAKIVDQDLSKVFDTHFAGEYGNMLVWLAFCIRFNFASFLGEIASELTGALANLGIRRKVSGSKSPV